MVAAQRRGVAEQVVTHQHRHGAAHVRVGGHQRFAGRLGLIGQRGDERAHARLQQRNAAPQVEAEVDRHLFVARPAGVQAASVVADQRHELTFHEGVDVFVVARHPGRILAALGEDGGEPFANPRHGRRVEHPGSAERISPRQATGDVVLEELAVEVKRHAEVEGGRIRRLIEPSRPQMPAAHACTSMSARRHAHRPVPLSSRAA